MSRVVGDWLDAYLEYTDDTEPPRSYHTWVGISCIAGALQRRVWLEWGFERIHPNMYIVLVGPSGRTRKGSALAIGKDLLKEVGVPTTAEAVTRESLVRRMFDKTVSFLTPEGRAVYHCSMTCFSEELSVFLGQNDIKFLSNLTDWYDSHAEWTYETKNSGIDHLQGLCFNLLGATAPEWFQSILPQEAIGGGFTSRIIFVVEERKRKTVPEPTISPKAEAIRRGLIADLQRIFTLSGPCQFNAAAKLAYTDWYVEQDRLLADGQLPVDDPRFSGYAERRATHLRKLMIVLSASHSDTLIITPSDFSRAVDILTSVEKNMHKTFGGFGKAPSSDAVEKVMSYLRISNISTRSTILRKFYRDIDSQAIDVVEDTLVKMHFISVSMGADGDKTYRLLNAAEK